MQDIYAAMEQAFAEMDDAFIEWSDTCDALARTPDLPGRLEKANIAHEKFLVARNRFKQIMECYQRMIMEERGY